MSPGKRPSQPRPTPAHSSAPAAAMTKPITTKVFPSSLINSNAAIYSRTAIFAKLSSMKVVFWILDNRA